MSKKRKADEAALQPGKIVRTCAYPPCGKDIRAEAAFCAQHTKEAEFASWLFHRWMAVYLQQAQQQRQGASSGLIVPGRGQN